jgi:hypothetical protein
VTKDDDDSVRRTPLNVAGRLLDVRRIYHEPDIERFPRARQIFERFPAAERIEVLSHQAIPGLYGNEGNVADWVRVKREVLRPSRLGVRHRREQRLLRRCDGFRQRP